jgi:pimeloyl-ACP methyl ester carboxylesterase
MSGQRRIARFAFLLALGGAACTSLGPGTRIDVGGHRLRLYCSGEGEPVVVMDAGLGDSLEVWSELRPLVADFARVCVYDRAGLGGSDPGPLPRTSAVIVEDLRRLLARAGEPAPYVLVGHSFGGLNVLLFAGRHPEEVAGLVLVDATHEDFPAIDARSRPEAERLKMETNLAATSPSALSELQSIEESARQVREAAPPPEVPLVVVSSGLAGGSPEAAAAWRRLQLELARKVEGGVQIIAERSGHYIQHDQPALVAEAIRQVRTEAGR